MATAKRNLRKNPLNLSATISLHGGGVGSGCNPDKGKCGRRKGPGAPPTSTQTTVPASSNHLVDFLLHAAKDNVARHTAIQMAALINKHGGIDARLYERLPISSIQLDDTGMLQDYHAIAAYNAEKNRMMVAESTSRYDDGYSMPEIATHEYGHHLYAKWLQNSMENEISNMRTPNRGADWNQAKATADHDAMFKEYQTQADIVNKALDAPEGYGFGTDPDRYVNGQPNMGGRWREIKAIEGLKYPAIRGLANPNEWFAETFREYMSGDSARAKLARDIPASYRLVDTLVHGGYFTKAAN